MKLLITGARGFLGRSVLAELALANGPWQPIGLGRSVSQPNSIPNFIPNLISNSIQCDLTDRAATIACLDSLAPAAILHLAAEANPARCEADPAASAIANVTATATIAQYCADRDLPLVFTSTDLVFSGPLDPRRPAYREPNPIGPLNAYARQKAEAEAEVLTRCPRAIVARMPVMFGLGARNFMATLVEGLQMGRSVSLFADEYRTPVSGAAAARGLIQSIGWARDDRHRGLLHLGGPDRLSRYEFGLLLAEVLGYDPSLLRPCNQADIPGLGPRPQDVALDSGLAYGLGYGPGSVRSMVDRLGVV
jgi:dTDP-4-dehydrorhamnose reductase